MVTTAPILNTTDRFVREFEILKNQLEEQSPEWLFSLRKDAIQKFKQLGIPTSKNENWKYASLEKIFKDYSHNIYPIEKAISPEKLDALQIDGLESIRITTYNGRFVVSLSNTDQLPKGVVICSFSKSCETHAEVIKKYFSQIASFEKEAMLALNTAFATEGLFLYVPKNVVIEKPIHIQNIVEAHEGTYYFQRNLIVMESGTKANIIETYHSSSEGIWNEVNEIVVGEQAQLHYYKLQYKLSNLAQLTFANISQATKSKVHTVTFTGYSKWIRNSLRFSLEEEHTETHLNGLYLTKENEFVDNHTWVDHKMPNCYSSELYKGIMGDQSTAVFNGKVFVHRDAQKTNAYQSNKNILLTNDAKIFTKPELEIYADDVKCSHGATTGQLDQEAMFYLRARGISEENAKALLLSAFMRDVLSSVKIEALRNYIENGYHL